MSHEWMSHVTRMNNSCPYANESCVCVSHMNELCYTLRIWVSHVKHVHESCHTYEWVIWNIWMSHVTPVNESCHICKWVMSHIWMRHVTHMNESCHTHEFVMQHTWMCHITHMNESCFIRLAIRLCIAVVCFAAHAHPTQMKKPCHTYECVMSHLWISHVTHVKESCHRCKWVTSHQVGDEVVVQEYVLPPMLIGSRKFDIRCFCMVWRHFVLSLCVVIGVLVGCVVIKWCVFGVCCHCVVSSLGGFVMNQCLIGCIAVVCWHRCVNGVCCHQMGCHWGVLSWISVIGSRVIVCWHRCVVIGVWLGV